MEQAKRVFIIGAGFSKPAGMPLATELLDVLAERLGLDEMGEWLDGMRQRLDWLTGGDPQTSARKLNIEEVFHYAHFDIEVHRLRQHLAPVGRRDGPGTAWNQAESISAWLSYLERELCDVICESEVQAKIAPINRWAERINAGDSVVTFNYDTLVERALSEVGKNWNHGFSARNNEVTICKLHGSIDWIVAHRSEQFSNLDLLFDKENENRSDQNTGHVEEDCRLWRCQSREQMQHWVSGRDLQMIPEGVSTRSIGIAGLGSYKQLHKIPGLGRVWMLGMQAIYEADSAIVVGFSMSDFDAIAQMQFCEIAKKRQDQGRALKVIVIDPLLNDTTKERFRRVFRSVEFVNSHHETVDWMHF